MPGITLILLTWRIWWAPNNASRRQVGFNSVFKGLMHFFYWRIFFPHIFKIFLFTSYIWNLCCILLLIPVDVRLKAWIYGSSLAGISVGVDVCILRLLCVVRRRSLHRAGHSSRGVLPPVVCLNECDPETSYWRPGTTTAVETWEKKLRYLTYKKSFVLAWRWPSLNGTRSCVLHNTST